MNCHEIVDDFMPCKNSQLTLNLKIIEIEIEIVKSLKKKDFSTLQLNYRVKVKGVIHRWQNELSIRLGCLCSRKVNKIIKSA